MYDSYSSASSTVTNKLFNIIFIRMLKLFCGNGYLGDITNFSKHALEYSVRVNPMQASQHAKQQTSLVYA